MTPLSAVFLGTGTIFLSRPHYYGIRHAAATAVDETGARNSSTLVSGTATEYRYASAGSGEVDAGAGQIPDEARRPSQQFHLPLDANGRRRTWC
jgi:hypothetical protein